MGLRVESDCNKHHNSSSVCKVNAFYCRSIWYLQLLSTYPAKGPWSRSLNFIFPPKYKIPNSLKVSHWLSKSTCKGTFQKTAIFLRSFRLPQGIGETHGSWILWPRLVGLKPMRFFSNQYYVRHPLVSNTHLGDKSECHTSCLKLLDVLGGTWDLVKERDMYV